MKYIFIFLVLLLSVLSISRKTLGPMFDRKDWGIMHLSAAAQSTYVIDDYESNDVIRIFTLKDGKRQAPKMMESMVNTEKWEVYESIACGGKYVLFNRGVDEDNVDIYWVDAKIIETLRPK